MRVAALEAMREGAAPHPRAPEHSRRNSSIQIRRRECCGRAGLEQAPVGPDHAEVRGLSSEVARGAAYVQRLLPYGSEVAFSLYLP
jgi:hypothetical protein